MFGAQFIVGKRCQEQKTAGNCLERNGQVIINILSKNMAFAAPKDTALTADILEALEIGKERSVQGVVFELNACSGFNRQDL